MRRQAMASAQVLPQRHPFFQAGREARPARLGPHLSAAVQSDLIDDVVGVIDHLHRQGAQHWRGRQQFKRLSQIQKDRGHLGDRRSGNVIDQHGRPHERHGHLPWRLLHERADRRFVRLRPGPAGMGENGANELAPEGNRPIIEGEVRHGALQRLADRERQRGWGKRIWRTGPKLSRSASDTTYSGGGVVRAEECSHFVRVLLGVAHGRRCPSQDHPRRHGRLLRFGGAEG
uniref:LigA n=1 Tax=Parastrongyloides trichosuri TaxID=131310 RepID=A0A0N4ZEH1_PARTI